MLRHVRRWVHANMRSLLESNPNNLAARLNLEHRAHGANCVARSSAGKAFPS
jgi:hypothetical protein